MSSEEKQLEIRENVLNSEKDKKEEVASSSIYHYMKSHPGSLAALISAIIATISFVLNAALYRKTSAYLKFWGFNAENITVDSGNQIYVVALSFVFLLAMGGLTYFLCQTFHVFQKRANVLLYLRMDSKYACREILKLRIGMVGVLLGAWLCKKRGATKKQIDEINADVADQKSRIDALSQRIKARQKTLWLLRRSNVIMLLPSLLMAYGLLLLLIGLSGVTEELRAVIRYPELALSIVVLSLIGFVYLLVRFEFRAEKRKIRKAFKRDYESAYRAIEELSEQNNKQYPMVQMIKGTAGDIFNNRMVGILVLLLVVTLLIAFSAFSTPDKSTTSQKTTFSVVSIEGQDYVITYTCGTTYYLNQADVNCDEKTIVVSTTNQRIITSEDMKYDIVKFESVKIESEQEG